MKQFALIAAIVLFEGFGFYAFSRWQSQRGRLSSLSPTERTQATETRDVRTEQGEIFRLGPLSELRWEGKQSFRLMKGQLELETHDQSDFKLKVQGEDLRITGSTHCIVDESGELRIFVGAVKHGENVFGTGVFSFKEKQWTARETYLEASLPRLALDRYYWKQENSAEFILDGKIIGPLVSWKSELVGPNGKVESSGSDAYYRVELPRAPGQYELRVKLVDGSDELRQLIRIQELKSPLPRKESPSVVRVIAGHDQPALFFWMGDDRVDYYEFTIHPEQSSTGRIQTNHHPQASVRLREPGNYVWRVRAFHQLAGFSSWTNTELKVEATP